MTTTSIEKRVCENSVIKDLYNFHEIPSVRIDVQIFKYVSFIIVLYKMM